MVKHLVSKEEHSFEWIDITNPDLAELSAIANQYGLHQSSVQDCLDPAHLPKYEEIDDSLFIISRIYDAQAKHSALSIQEVSRKIAIFISKKCFITIHRSEQIFLEEIKKDYINTRKCESEYHLLSIILDEVFQSYEQPSKKLSEEIDYYESKIFLRNRIPDLLKSLYRIKRRASVIRRILSLSTEIIHRLEEKKIKRPYVRELHDKYIHIDTLYDEIWEEIHTLLSLYLSISSQKTNEVIRVLTIFSVFFMPLTFIVGIYGMNFSYMPELKWEYAYPAVMLGMLLITGIIYYWFKKRGWL